jgi:MFS family permease
MQGLDGRFTRLLAAAGVSNLGDGVAQAAMPLLVASLTRDPLLVAGATIASQGPWLLFALVSGAMVDRLDRRRTMIVVDAIRAMIMAVLALAIVGGRAEIWLIYMLAFALTSAETLFDPASEAILPQMVGRDALAAANSRPQGVTWVANSFLGPPLGAILFAAAAGLPFVLDAASFVIAAVLVTTIPGVYRAARAEGRSSLGREIGDGLRFLARHRVLRWTTPMAGMTNLAAFSIIAIFVLYVQDVLGLDPLGYGLLISGLGVGGLAGAMAAGRVLARIGSSAAIKLTLFLGFVAGLTLALVGNPVVAAIAIVIFGFQITLWNVTVVSLRQALVPDAMRGRIAGSSRLVTWGTQPIGALAGGLLAGAFGLQAPLLFSAAVFGLNFVLASFTVTPRAIAEARRVADAAEVATPA